MYTGYQDFAKIHFVPAFVDKSMLIKAVLNNDVRLLLIAPRRFCKSINISILKRFLELLPDAEEMKRNQKLFEGLLIQKQESIMKDHQQIVHGFIFDSPFLLS